jgi:erythronate-4-phosphate dehydrogenase
MINEITLELVKQGVWLINSSRGEVVDGNILKTALNVGKLAGAVLDVWENEPNVDLQLLDKTFLATPHIAGYSTDGKMNGTVQVVRSLGTHFDLPLKDWKPSGIPEPVCPLISLDCRGQSSETSICQAILHTYDVMDDNLRFHADPAGFEQQRGSYPVRREFPAFKLKLINAENHLKSLFESLGFQLI